MDIMLGEDSTRQYRAVQALQSTTLTYPVIKIRAAAVAMETSAGSTQTKISVYSEDGWCLANGCIKSCHSM